MYLHAEKIEIKKTKVLLTVSLDVDKYEDPADKVRYLIDMIVSYGCSQNIRKQILTDYGVVKIGDKHRFH